VAHSTQLQRDGGNDHARIGLERKQISQLRNCSGEKNVADTKRVRSHSTEDKQVLGRTRAGQLCLEQSRNYWRDWWTVEPDVGRVANGVAARVDRLKAIGNGQVPLCAATAWLELSKQL
jgi:DNA (cytosine-5)-methyltransferase 1